MGTKTKKSTSKKPLTKSAMKNVKGGGHDKDSTTGSSTIGSTSYGTDRGKPARQR